MQPSGKILRNKRHCVQERLLSGFSKAVLDGQNGVDSSHESTASLKADVDPRLWENSARKTPSRK
jgi:hypothetical protein